MEEVPARAKTEEIVSSPTKVKVLVARSRFTIVLQSGEVENVYATVALEQATPNAKALNVAVTADSPMVYSASERELAVSETMSQRTY